QTVTVTGVNDATPDGDVAYSIVLGTPTSTDSAYTSLNPPDVSVTNRDDDAVTCSPRPNVSVSTANNGDGRLRVTIGATTSPPGQPNHLLQLQFDDGARNTNVQLPGQPTRTGTFTYDIPNQPTSYTFFVGRQAAGATYLPFHVIDGCASQPWKT